MNRIYLLVSGMEAGKCEVVCLHDTFFYNHFKEATKNTSITYIKLDEQDAVKLLVEGNGIGVGCHVSTKEGDVDALRSTRSRKNMVEFAKKLNIPVWLASHAIKPNDRQRDVLKLRN